MSEGGAAVPATPWRSRWRELLRLPARRRLPALLYHRGYALALPDTPVDPLRAEKVLTALELLGLRPGPVIAAPSVSLRDLLRVHHREYLESLGSNEPFERAFGMPLSEAQRERILGVQRLMAGGTVAAARRAVAAGSIVVNLGGGLHHARADRAAGFCLFNDVAVAIAALRRSGFQGRVLVVDLDVHDGDGTRALFAADPTVHTYSLHNRHWDDPAAVSSTAIELGSEVGDEEYLRTLRETLPAVFAEHRPELVFYLAGSDPAADDRLGDWRITPGGMLARDRFVVELVRGPALHRAGGRGTLPLVVLLSGGYGERAWRYTARFLAWLGSGGRSAAEPPPDDEVLMARYRAVARLLSPAELSGDEAARAGTADTDWGLTEEDLFGSVGRETRESRLLGYYTAHGLELVLESSGLFDRLRDLGFEQPTLELDLAAADSHLLRIWGSPGRRELVAEVRLRRDRQSIAGFELLANEWLLLQNPRAAFTAERPALPGQRHPGLGMLRDVIALLVQVCHRLHLDGLTYTPSHYHLVSQSTKYLHFRHPRDAATFDALQEALVGLPLAEAARRIEAGEVVDARSGEPFRWQPMPMVLVVSDGLERWFEEQGYEEKRAAARAEMDFRVVPRSPQAR
jgi:acetoin utilization deacetylase AcuC-like enzyme